MTKRNYYIFFLLFFCTLYTHSTFSQISPQALKQWKDQKYSMFIHWGGIYSVLGGVWDGKPIDRGLSEQIQAHAGIYSDTYANVAKKFNPIYWNADSIALLAKEAGMRSIVITSKHHDGFCMWNTRSTDFDVVDATPFKRDVLKELSDACKRHEISFGLYFSLIDWHYPEASPISSHNSDRITPSHHEYNKQQLTELLTNYGSVTEIWFDMGSQSLQQSQELRELVHRLQPDCMIGSRIGNDMGDFTVMGDNQEPDYVIEVPWQSPASFFDETWGYRSWQKRVPLEEKQKEKLTSLIRVVSRGGKYLLNIGPKGDGSVVPYEKEVLLKTGEWLKKNSEAIYGVSSDPFHTPFEWGSVTSSSDKLYLHLLSLPQNKTIVLPGLTGKIKSVEVLGNKKYKIKVGSKSDGVVLKLPEGLDVSKDFQVIGITFSNGYKVAPFPVTKEIRQNEIVLSSTNAFKHYSNSGIDYNTRYLSTVKESWNVQPATTGKWTPVLYYSAEEKGKKLDIQITDKTQQITLDGREVVKLQNNLTALIWSPLYLAGPFYSGIEGVHGDVTKLTTTAAWENKPWTPQSEWKQGETYTIPSESSTAWYVLQEITSTEAQSLLIRITSGDAVLVLLNGKQLLIHNNPEKVKSLEDMILLPLQKGKNQLLIKLYNYFQKEIPFSLSAQIPQELYKLPLPSVSLQVGSIYPFSWKWHQPLSPHYTLIVPNLSLQLIKQ
ncbi:alpha-L-fucosidase [Cytophagaceae bacterium DM2B3-1]|uniref:alpha-L-fucosidase n=1 Tax=Xanthocytophaga flava TaxID=3048013 RepID=A0ABT7CKY3_9BACT|nr:alpha-L-fucosidase [Xanthocytophaga flavus]MDJ1494196.1 alpha-L-fucosidase [Xanthocytophaga flavus]